MHLFRRGDNHDARFRDDGLLVGDQEPPLGSYLVTPRRGYLHHGIYVGARTVVHYAGLAHGLRRGPVEEIPLAHFARRHAGTAPRSAQGMTMIRLPAAMTGLEVRAEDWVRRHRDRRELVPPWLHVVSVARKRESRRRCAG